MVVRDTQSVASGSELVAVGVVPFLICFEGAEVVPGAVGLGDEVVDVADVACLGGSEGWVGGRGDGAGCGWEGLGNHCAGQLGVVCQCRG